MATITDETGSGLLDETGSPIADSSASVSGVTGFVDDFTGADSTVLIGSPAPNGSYVGRAAWTIDGNRALAPSGTASTLVFDAGSADAVVSATIVDYGGSGASAPGICGRWSDADHFIRLAISGATVYLIKDEGTPPWAGWVVPSYSGVLSLQMVGNVYTARWNGALLGTYTDTANNYLTETFHGLNNDGTGGIHFDDLTVLTGVTVYADDFNRANGAIGDSPVGTPYEGSVYTIDSNQALAPSGAAPSYLIFDAGNDDAIVAVGMVESEAASIHSAGAMLRFTSNLTHVFCAAYNHDIVLVQRTGGVDTVWATYVGVGDVAGKVLACRVEGNVYTTTLGGVTLGTYTDATNFGLGITKHGFSCFDQRRVNFLSVTVPTAAIVAPIEVSAAHLTVHTGTAVTAPLISPAHLTAHVGAASTGEALNPGAGEWPWFSPYEHTEVIAMRAWLGNNAVATDDLSVQLWALPAIAIAFSAGAVPWSSKTAELATIPASETWGEPLTFNPPLSVQKNEGLRVDIIAGSTTVPPGAELFVSLTMVVASAETADQTTTHVWGP